MAKASAQITISRIVDISSVTRYYLLRSSTSAAPSKPTANPPGGSWTTTEPAYTSGSTNTLYFVDLTVFTNSTFSYSAVSKSSSYEAAKAAYNKALDAAKTATNYMKFENNVGLIVGDMTANTLGKNVLIDADSVDIRDGSTVAASFSANQIDLGSANSSSKINLCGIGEIKAAELNAGAGYNLMSMYAPSVSISGDNRVGIGTSMASSSYTKGTDTTMGTYGNGVLHAKYNSKLASVGVLASTGGTPSATVNSTNGTSLGQIEVTPTSIDLSTNSTGSTVNVSTSQNGTFNVDAGDINLNAGGNINITATSATKINVGSQYVQFETDGSYPGIATANYIRTPTSGIIPKTSGGSGSVGTSGWPFNSGYFKNLYVNGTAVSVSGHTHSYLPLSGGTVTGTLYLNNNTDASGAADNNVPLIIGNRAGNHLIIDANEIIAKSSGTAVTKLYLQDSGGYVYIGNDRVLPHKMLYSGSTTGTVTLTETAANFLYFIIIVGFSDTGSSGTICVYSPNGKTVDANAVAVSSNSASVGRVRYVISGTTMTASNNYLAKSTNSSWSYSKNSVYCKAVIGFR
jgi:hypothetical protein